MYECYAYGTAKENMEDENVMSIGIPRYKEKDRMCKDCVLDDVC